MTPTASTASSGLPLAERLPDGIDVVEMFRRMASLPHVLFLDSALRGGRLGRYSFLAADPFHWIECAASPFERSIRSLDPRIECAASSSEPFAEVERLWQAYRVETDPDLPPFQGGVAGLFGYELAQSLERLPPTPMDDLPVPALAMGCYDVVIAVDHEQGESWIISQGFPETEPCTRRERASLRLQEFRQLLICGRPPAAPRSQPRCLTRDEGELAPVYDVGHSEVRSNFSPEKYRHAVRQAVDSIHAGELFQVNLSQRLICQATSSPFELYLRLRECNPAPYAGYFDLGTSSICSGSPECFLTVRGGQVETRPIKGTCARESSPEADLFRGDELRSSVKDRAENVMIVDLMRNDLSRVCAAESVHVAQLCRLETYSYVKHLVSVVRGQLRLESSPVDLLKACFPGGSITGAPKIRAMEMIAQMEPTARGAYCGSLGYLGFDGQMDTSILIRTITAGHGWWQLPVGGGIVAQSDPDEEYQETWHKARGMLQAISCYC